MAATPACADLSRDEAEGGHTGAGLDDATGHDGDAAEGDDTAGESGLKLDVGGVYDLPGQETEGCEKVDFLFVIDNSASMQTQQKQLIEAFPQFIATIRNEVDATDYHILIADSDGGTDPEHYACAGWPGLLGTGIRRAESDRGPDCGFDTDQRFMTDLQTDLEGTFACAALVGTAGWGFEFPMSSMAAAIGPEHLGPGGCNEGFLRDDAVLVITVITDDPDVGNSPDDSVEVGTPEGWYQAVIDAKLGNPQAVVMLGLVPMGGGLRGTTEKFIELVALFGEQGIAGEVIQSDYGPFFSEAVAKIDETCESFVPPG